VKRDRIAIPIPSCCLAIYNHHAINKNATDFVQQHWEDFMRTRLITRAMAALTIVLGLAFGSTDLLAAGKKAGQGETCGGIIGVSCNKGLWCQNAPGQCKVADAQGKCEVIPKACEKIRKPVCACNGKTYANDCLRQRARAQLDHEGACEKKKY
jgi:hypothetical protein